MKKIPLKEWSSSVGSDGSLLDDDDFIVIDSAVIIYASRSLICKSKDDGG